MPHGVKRPKSGRAPDSEQAMRAAAVTGKERIDWVDYAKGLCIVMVVTMHSTFGVEQAVGAHNWLHSFSVFTHPFRMPA
jgi:uncharacterized membrane protein YcfT